MNTKSKTMRRIILSGLSLMFAVINASAQTQTVDGNPDAHPVEIPKAMFDPDFWIIFFLAGLLLFVIISLAYSVNKLSRTIYASQAVAEGKVVPARVTGWQKLMERLTRSVPVEHEKDVMLDHDYDGIRELDNKLPPWWVYGFYVTIIIAVVYFFNYHIAKTSKLQIAEYNAEMMQAELEKTERAKIAGNNITPENAVVLNDAAAIAEGKEIFTKNCVACHGNLGQGNVGPNLTDQYWIHGGGIKNLFTTITNGVPQKGMISWKAQLVPKQIEEVASFVLTLKGTNPPGAKDPQGDLYNEMPTDSSAKAVSTAVKPDSTSAGKM
jgi:cytochrome c oxidase cbb3-type subunit 3